MNVCMYVCVCLYVRIFRIYICMYVHMYMFVTTLCILIKLILAGNTFLTLMPVTFPLYSYFQVIQESLPSLSCKHGAFCNFNVIQCYISPLTIFPECLDDNVKVSVKVVLIDSCCSCHPGPWLLVKIIIFNFKFTG